MAVTSYFKVRVLHNTAHTKTQMCVRTQQTRVSLLYDKCPITPQDKSRISVLPTACETTEGCQTIPPKERHQYLGVLAREY